jgi:hypothetical protein
MTLYLKLSVQDHTKIISMNKDQKRVLKEYPNAKMLMLEDGSYVVECNDAVLTEEYFMPTAYDTDTAWKYAALACKTTQNFNRTHPERLSLIDIESKLSRIQKRKKNAKKN